MQLGQTSPIYRSETLLFGRSWQLATSLDWSLSSRGAELRRRSHDRATDEPCRLTTGRGFALLTEDTPDAMQDGVGRASHRMVVMEGFSQAPKSPQSNLVWRPISIELKRTVLHAPMSHVTTPYRERRLIGGFVEVWRMKQAQVGDVNFPAQRPPQRHSVSRHSSKRSLPIENCEDSSSVPSSQRPTRSRIPPI